MADGDVWTTIESDPGVFTELISEIGVMGVQVEELYSLEPEALQDLRPVYGLVFLFKWRGGHSEAPVQTDDANGRVFFASQVITNACATQAILAVLLNRPEIQLGEGLTSLRDFTQTFSPEMKGLAIGNSDSIRRAHNSFAPPDPIVSEERQATPDDDLYHFISYVPVDGGVYELDGLKPGPVKVGSADEDSWLDVVRPHILQRIEVYSKSEIRFNLMALVKNRKLAASEALEQAEQLRLALEVSLSPDSPPQQREHLQQVERHISGLQQEIAAEEAKFMQWSEENVRRRHNFVPFLFTFLTALAEKDALQPLIEQARAEQQKG